MTYVRAWHVSLLRHEVDCGSDGEVATLIEKTKSSNARNASILIKESIPCLYPGSARIRRASRNWVHSSSRLWYISFSSMALHYGLDLPDPSTLTCSSMSENG